MQCSRCANRGMVEIRMKIAGEDVMFRQCGRCEAKTWLSVDGPMSLSRVLDWPASPADVRARPRPGVGGKRAIHRPVRVPPDRDDEEGAPRGSFSRPAACPGLRTGPRAEKMTRHDGERAPAGGARCPVSRWCPSPAADAVLPPTDRDLTVAWRVLAALSSSPAAALVLWQLNPRLLLRTRPRTAATWGRTSGSRPTCGTTCCPNFRVAGWSPDWFAGLPGRAVLLPAAGAARGPARPRPAVQRGVQARSPCSGRSRCPRRRTASPGAQGAPARTGALRGRDRRCSSSSRASAADPGTHDATIQFNQRIMGGPIVSALGGVLVHARVVFGLGFLGALAYPLRTGSGCGWPRR